MKNSCVILFSGGTDSMCAAALAAKNFKHIHLLTFYEAATKNSPVPTDNVEKLKKHFPGNEFKHLIIETDATLQKMCYENYLKNIFRFHFYNLATPGLSSLSWHIEAILYCKKNQIQYVFDGMTQELTHLPGHMKIIRNIFTVLYQKFEISFSSEVIDFPVPPNQIYVEKLIVNQHGFFADSRAEIVGMTTGKYLYELNLMPHPNVKGSQFDNKMQHDCYPYVVYNLLYFWLLPFFSNEISVQKNLFKFFQHKADVAFNHINFKFNELY